jgi:hypothetical protein
MTDGDLARMTPEQLGLEVLVPLIASKGSISREPQTIAMLLEHREPTFGRDLDVDAGRSRLAHRQRLHHTRSRTE